MSVSRETWAEIRKGITDIWAVGLGLVSLGLAFGLVITQAGFAWWWAPIFSLVIYAGSTEFLAVTMITGGAGPVSAALSGFMVNFRHIFYGLTYPRSNIRSALGRAYATYSLTDEAYAIVSAKPRSERLSGTRLMTIHIGCQLFWVLPGILGALAGQVIPPQIQGMDFALTALFIVLAYEAFQATRDLSAVAIALGLGLVCMLLIPGQMLIVGLLAYFAVLVARFWRPDFDQRLVWKV